MMAKNSSHGTPEQFEHLVRQRIEELSGSVESTTSITADTDESGLFADPNGVIGDAGELYTYQELKQMYDDGIADGDQWFASYPTFEHWYRQIVLGYLTRVTSEADLVNDDEDELGSWKLLGSKQVLDTDGFWTDYTLWVNNETGTYVCIFGDNDIYTPETASPDFETESKFEAYEWFEDYDTGELEGEDDIYDEIHGSVSSGRSPVVAKDNGIENPGYVSLIIDIIPDLLTGDGIADEVTKVSQAEGSIVFTFKKDGDTYTARFPEYELTGSDPDDLPDDEWLIEDAARDAISGINAATNTCNMPSTIDADMEETSDYMDVVIESADDLGNAVSFTNIKDVIDWLNRKGIDTTKHRYELEAEEYRRYESGPTYRYRFTAPGDWVAYVAMQLHRDMSPNAVVEYINDYFDNEEELAEISSIPAIRDTAAMSWWGDGDDFIHYLKNLDTGEMLYQTDDSMYEEYDDDDYDVE